MRERGAGLGGGDLGEKVQSIGGVGIGGELGRGAGTEKQGWGNRTRVSPTMYLYLAQIDLYCRLQQLSYPC